MTTFEPDEPLATAYAFYPEYHFTMDSMLLKIEAVEGKSALSALKAKLSQ